ncbi:MAG: hypothetical protein ACLFP1_04635 [Candidatus Goldiibacteriota bacterium]
MKKTPVLLLLFIFLLSPGLQAQNNQWKLVFGILFTAAGGYFSYEGIRFVDKTDPGADVSDWSWSKDQNGSWTADYSGTFSIDGNVDLKNAAVTVTFRDINNEPLGSDSAVLSGSGSLSPGDSASFSGTLSGLSDEPYYAAVDYAGDYNAVMETNNAGLGITGITMTVCGVYLLADYFIDFGSVFGSNDVEIGLYPHYDGAAITAAKSF